VQESTARKTLDVIQEGVEEAALLAALGYEASSGRPGRILLNNALERCGYGRPISEQTADLAPYRPYPDTWKQEIAKAVTGRPDAPLHEIADTLRKTARNP
jgi:hypothetical protein